MKKYLFLIITLSQLVISCENIRTNDGEELSNLELQIPEDLKDKVEEAQLNSHLYKGSFPDISATYSIYFETLTIDSSNSVIKSVKVILDKGSNKCLFNSNIDKTQHNARTIGSYSTLANVQVGYIQENQFSTKSENAVFTISSEGNCISL